MSDPVLARAHAADRIADRNAYLAIAAIVIGSAAVSSLSQGTESLRQGGGVNLGLPWIYEGSSAALTLALFPAILWITRRFPVDDVQCWRTWLPAHALASLVFSILHVAGMVALRKLAVPVIAGAPYLFTDDLVRDLVYEYRKDAFSYTLYVFLIVASRHLQQLRIEAEAAREDARAQRRLTVKCGGRTVWIDAADVVWAKAASNYVEIRAGDRTHLARATLATVARQLADAGVGAARVHRSWIVNPAHVAEIAPTGEGDARIVMRNGDVAPASRRYRAAWPGTA